MLLYFFLYIEGELCYFAHVVTCVHTGFLLRTKKKESSSILPFIFVVFSSLPLLSPPEVSCILRKGSYVQLLNQANKTLLSIQKVLS